MSVVSLVQATRLPVRTNARLTWSALRTICSTNFPPAGTTATKDIAWSRHRTPCLDAANAIKLRNFGCGRKRRWQQRQYTVSPLYLESQWEEQYRKPITRELWKEFQNEGQRTRDYLSSPSSSSQPSLESSPTGYTEIWSELQAQIYETWNGPGALEPPPESGPTGKWTYQFNFSADGSSRVYERKPQPQPKASSGMAPPETVLELPPGIDALAMSLTPDEACVASLLQESVEGGSLDPWIVLRSMESGKELSLSGTEWLGGIAILPSEVVGLEWGPIRTRGETAGSGPDFVYSLYLLLADHQGRPDRVALCHLHPTTLQLLTPPTLIYSSDDPAVTPFFHAPYGCRKFTFPLL